MNDSQSPAASSAPVALGPVLEPERVAILDVLRGLALLGVVIANVWLWFSGIIFRFPDYQHELRQISLDSAVYVAVAVLVSGKAISTFSFLFGLGFGIQMLRARTRRRSIAPIYARRLAVLLVIGLAHMVLLWYGDILTVYALLGFVLLLFRNRAEGTLLAWSAILLVVVALLGALPWTLGAFGVALPEPNATELARRNASTLAAFQAGSYWEIFRENLREAGRFWLGPKATQVLYLFALFLLGLYAGRRRVFEHRGAHRVMFRRIAGWGIPIGLTASIGISVLQVSIGPALTFARPGLILLSTLLFVAGTLPLAAGYVSVVTLLFDNRSWAWPLSLFAPVGRMALTNYLMQTVVMLLIFYSYGGGLVGRTGPAAGLVIALAVFGVQMAWSRVWLTRFQFGPMEWLWRALTYGTLPAMRLGQAPVGAVAVSGTGGV